MANSYDECMELAEELQPLPLEHRPTGRRTRLLVVLGVGFAAAASYTLMPGAHSTSIYKSAAHGLQAKDEVQAAPAPVATAVPAALAAPAAPATVKAAAAAPVEIPRSRIVEGSLGDLIDADSMPHEASPRGFGGSLGGAAEALFEHVMERSGMKSELTQRELEAFKFRFIASMLGTQSSNRDITSHEDYVAQAKKSIDGTKPVMTQALAASINKRQSDFQVKMEDWMLDESMDSLADRLIKVPYEVSPENRWKQHEESVPGTDRDLDPVSSPNLPSEFFSAENWPKCKEVIVNPHNQGRCGSCWVFGATGALDSRLCIVTDGAFSGKNAALSRGFSASCAVDYDGCQGGWPHNVYDYIEKSLGVPSTNCVPYFAGTDYHNHWSDSMPAPACPTSCDARFPELMSQDYFKPVGISNYRLVNKPDEKGISQLKNAIYKEGPCPYAFYANNEFMGYSGGTFSSGCHQQANHAVQAIGWGKDGHGKEFIQSLNSWGTGWGVEGTFNVAHCVVWHFVIPGSFQNAAFPLPIPSWTHK